MLKKTEWSGKKDIQPFIDRDNPNNNIILTNSEKISLNKGRNILVVGETDSGKTFNYIKPNLMQKNSSYVINDFRGKLFEKYSKWLSKNGYKVKKFDVSRFEHSDCYNPFSYIHKETMEQDINRLVDVLIKNTSGLWKQLDDESFEIKIERILLKAYIAMIFCILPTDEMNFESLLDYLKNSEVQVCENDNDNDFKNVIDWQFETVEKWLNNDITDSDVEIIELFGDIRKYEPTDEQKIFGEYACKQYRIYKSAAGKMEKSIIISCTLRLVSSSIDKMLRITSKDELALDSLGDEPTALFIISSPYDCTRNMITTLLWTQLFDRYTDCSVPKYPIHFLIDDFQEIGYIPNLKNFLLRKEIQKVTASFCIQSLSQFHSIYEKELANLFDAYLFICLNCLEKATFRFMSNTLTSISTETLAKELLKPNKNKCILFLHRVNKAFLSRKFNTEKDKRFLEIEN